MLSKCLNPACSTPFRYFRDGRIFNLETSVSSNSDGTARRREFFWLCGPCSTTMKVTLRDGAPIVEQRFLQLISGESLERPDEKHPYWPHLI
jgi:hypothetical protein